MTKLALLARQPFQQKNVSALNQYRVRTDMTNQLATCIECGCNDFQACEQGCWWVRVDYIAGLGVCSECAHRVKDWDSGDRTLSSATQMLLETPHGADCRHE